MDFFVNQSKRNLLMVKKYTFCKYMHLGKADPQLI